jgi:hypothetical protein
MRNSKDMKDVCVFVEISFLLSEKSKYRWIWENVSHSKNCPRRMRNGERRGEELF